MSSTKPKLSPYEKALTTLILTLIALALEVVFVYQYATSGVVRFSPTAEISGDVAFYFVLIMGSGVIIFTPLAIKRMIREAMN